MAGYTSPELASSVAQAAEDAGFYAILVWDHYSTPEGPESMDAWAILAYLAGRTSTIRLGTCVTPIPFRPPAQLAKIVATVDVLSGGRTILGVGAGWHQPEFDAFSQWDTDSVRVSRTIEAVELMVRLWTEDGVDFEGKYYSVSGAEIVPKPVQKPHPPLWFGVRGERMLRLAARYADGWIPTVLDSDTYRSTLAKIGGYRRELGLDPAINGALQRFNPSNKSEDRGEATFYNDCTDADAYVRSFAEFEDAGCGYYGTVWSFPPEEMVSRVGWFAREVMPRYG